MSKMKIHRLLLGTCASLFSMCMAAQNTHISVSVSNVPEGSEFYLAIGATHSDEDPIQTATVKNGKLDFAFDSEGIRLYNIISKNPSGVIGVMADKGDNVSVEATAKTQEAQGRTYYRFGDPKVTGSASHAEYEKKIAVRSELNDMYGKYHEDNKEVLDKLNAVQRGSEEAKAIMQSDAYKKFSADEANFFSTVETKYDELFSSNKDTWWGPFLMLDVMSYIPQGYDSVYSTFSKEAQESFYGKILKDQIVPASGVGSIVPDFKFVDHASGKTLSLYECLKGKKYVILDFWALWCGPCRKEIPNFKSQYELYKDKNFDIVSISADEKEAAWIKALDEEQLPWANGRDTDKSIGKLYKVQYYPTVYLLDSKGKVIAKDNDVRGENLRNMLKDLLK